MKRRERQAPFSGAQWQDQRQRAQTNTGGSLWTSGNIFFTVRVTEDWHKMSREVVESPSLEILKKYLDIIMGNQLWVTLLEQECWTRWAQRSLSTWTILWFCNRDLCHIRPKPTEGTELNKSVHSRINSKVAAPYIESNWNINCIRLIFSWYC